ncbi:hypothetical protein ACH5RR_012619 [Cinchona calisaya]|uniref:Uncharacterized protein n=1 Tax=Cinchona calisaya TaxID=153742 RepID=A0ABD3A9W3_9GENT
MLSVLKCNGRFRAINSNLGLRYWRLEVGGWDIILGVDWMFQYSPFVFDFRQLLIQLHQEGESITLSGKLEVPTIKVVKGKAVKKFQKERFKACNSVELHCKNSNQVTPLPNAISELLVKYQDVFDVPKSLPPKRPLDHQIPLKPNSQPFKMRLIDIYILKKMKLNYKFLTCYTMESSKTVLAHMLHLCCLSKKYGFWRFCIDYRHLNELTIKDRYPIPNIDELLNEMNYMVLNGLPK